MSSLTLATAHRGSTVTANVILPKADLRRASFLASVPVTTVHRLDWCPCSQKAHRAGPELLATSAAAVGIPLGCGPFMCCPLEEVLAPLDAEGRSLASTSRLMIFITLSTSHFSSVNSRLMISRISGGNLFIKIEVNKPLYDSEGTPRARSPLMCAATESSRWRSPLRS